MKVTTLSYREVSFVLDTFGLEGSHLPSESTWIEAYTTGWKTGASARSRKFRSIEAYYAYLNKVLAGGYISETAYHTAWAMGLALEKEIARKSNAGQLLSEDQDLGLS